MNHPYFLFHTEKHMSLMPIFGDFLLFVQNCIFDFSPFPFQYSCASKFYNRNQKIQGILFISQLIHELFTNDS